MAKKKPRRKRPQSKEIEKERTALSREMVELRRVRKERERVRRVIKSTVRDIEEWTRWLKEHRQERKAEKRELEETPPDTSKSDLVAAYFSPRDSDPPLGSLS